MLAGIGTFVLDCCLYVCTVRVVMFATVNHQLNRFCSHFLSELVYLKFSPPMAPIQLPDSDSEDELPPAWEERATNNGYVYYVK